MLLVIPGRKWNLLLYASGSSNYNTSLQGIFKLTTLDLSSTKLLIWFFKWILANGSRPPQHLTKHIWMFSMQYLGGFLVKMLIFVTQYLSLVVNTRRRGILTMLLKFLWLKVHKSNYMCIYTASQMNGGTDFEKSEPKHWMNNSPVCLLISWCNIKKHQLNNSYFLFYFNILIFIFNIFFIISANTTKKAPNINYTTMTP